MTLMHLHGKGGASRCGRTVPMHQSTGNPDTATCAACVATVQPRLPDGQPVQVKDIVGRDGWHEGAAAVLSNQRGKVVAYKECSFGHEYGPAYLVKFDDKVEPWWHGMSAPTSWWFGRDELETT